MQGAWVHLSYLNVLLLGLACHPGCTSIIDNNKTKSGFWTLPNLAAHKLSNYRAGSQALTQWVLTLLTSLLAGQTTRRLI
jgi:hypothetical protein